MCLLVGLADRGIAGHSAGRARDTGLVLAAFATLDVCDRIKVFTVGTCS